MVYIIPNLLVLHFGEKFMKIRTKIADTDENLHKNVFIHILMQNFMSFFLKSRQLRQLIS